MMPFSDIEFCKLCFSLRRQVAAINKLTARGMFFWDYGNAFLLEASRAGKDTNSSKIVINLKTLFSYLVLIDEVNPPPLKILLHYNTASWEALYNVHIHSSLCFSFLPS